MAKEPEPTPEESADKTFGWRRIVEFMQNVARLEGTVERFECENKSLREQVDKLQQRIDHHDGQIEVMISTLNSAVTDAVQTAANKAAMDTFAMLMGPDRPSDQD